MIEQVMIEQVSFGGLKANAGPKKKGSPWAPRYKYKRPCVQERSAVRLLRPPPIANPTGPNGLDERIDHAG